MKIEAVTTEELSRHQYQELDPGRVYHAPGRVLVVDADADESALLIIVEQPAQP